MAHDAELADRVRASLAVRVGPVREVRMFGGLSFLVDDAMVVNVGSAGDLLVRVDPGRAEEYLSRDGVSVAEMGTGRSMGRGWLAVDAAALRDGEDLASWIGAALDFHGMVAGRRRPGGRARQRADDFGWTS